MLFEFWALKPVISAETTSLHHGNHLQAYVDNLNKLLLGSGFDGLSLVDIVRQAPSGGMAFGGAVFTP